MAEQFRALTRNPVVPSLSPLLAGHAGVNSWLSGQLSCQLGFLTLIIYCLKHGTEKPLTGSCH